MYLGGAYIIKTSKKMPKIDTPDALDDAITTILTTNLDNNLDNQS